jgi:capsular polysaccharide transport system permease protein
MNLETLDHETLRTVARSPRERTRRQNWFWKRRWFILAVGLPTLLATIYYGFIASDVYVSESRFVIKSPGQKGPQTMTLASIVQTTGIGGGQEQTKEVLDYIRSRDALTDLQQTIDVKAAYSRSDVDLLSRFPRIFREPTFENLFRYYRSRISADVDTESGMAVLSTEAFAPSDAHRINARLLDLSEALVNQLNGRAEARAIAEGERRVMAAETRVRQARLALNAYRNRVGLLDPAKQAVGVMEITNTLIAERAALVAQLELMTREAPEHPAIPSLRSRVDAIGTQIAAQSSRAVGTPTGIASKLANYEKLEVEQEFATQMLTAANTSLEQARAEAQKQQFYLERVVEPNKPDMPTLPNRIKMIFVIFAVSICLYFIAWMLIVGILEHAPED